jgi:hypothetical protein
MLPNLERAGAELADGWLAFQSKGERRRLAPIPERWHEVDDSGLIALCRKAKKVPRRPSRLIE